MLNQIAKTILISLASSMPCLSNAQCDMNADNLYEKFKNYRETINTASKLEDLTGYFSQNFNQYFSGKLTTARGNHSKQRYLTQYWDNLNTAGDIVIVFDYSMKCITRNIVSLALVSILSQTDTSEGQEVELWSVKINYSREHLDWKIDSFEYETLGPGKNYLATEIKNNFVRIH
jgi:hypothetical protein